MGVYKRGNTWWISVSYQGYRERKPVGTNYEQAKAVLSKRRLELRDELFFNIINIKKIKFEDFIPEYLKFSQTHKRSSSRDELSSRHLLKHFQGFTLEQISPQDVEHYIQSRKADFAHPNKPITPATINRELSCLSAMFRYAITLNHAKTNPVGQVRKLKESNHRLDYLNVSEINSLLKATQNPLRSILVIAIHCGFRMSEILGLKWQDIDLENGTIQILNPKNGRARIGYMDIEVRHALGSMKRDWNSEYVFHHPDGKPFLKVGKSYKRALIRAGINRHFRFHDLRHTFASQMTMNGVDPLTLKELLGHSSLRMVERYAHLSDEHKREAVRKLEAGLSEIHTG